MKRGTIKKGDLEALLVAVSKDATCYAPVADRNGVALGELSPGVRVEIDYGNFTLSPKLHFFPRSEVIATGDNGALTAAPLAEGEAVLFGLRPCDAMALEFLDKIFLDDPSADPYYRSRREHTLVIALACSEPDATCFCGSVGGSPAGAAGADVVAFDLGDALLLEAATEKGEDFLAKHGSMLTAPTAEEETAKEELTRAAEAKLTAVAVEGISDKLSKLYDSPVWESFGERCLGCGVCTYLCPTCHCFAFHDEKTAATTRRIRAQDACMFPRFTVEASGHNPRNTQGERMRQRVMHKFCYTVENVGDVFCVGCGRCVTHCPVNIDIREILQEVGA